ncbi:MAG TPA: GNAT family N-acetyltransferase [Stellaceae bacterium]|jgi:RimJ/RimL family protein N-acetyltransferase|nr:GNAT family N-acetyltransferase [Stellaceae bacterium]
MLDLSEIPVLETPRLRLRRPESRDFEAYAALCADPEVMRYIGEAAPLSRRRAWHAFTGMLGHWALRGYGQFAVESKASAAFLGRVGLYEPDPWPGTEIAWALAREHWGRGFASEAAAAVRNWAFGSLGLARLVSVIIPENRASIRVAEKIGERFDREDAIDGTPVRIYAIENPSRTPHQARIAGS